MMTKNDMILNLAMLYAASKPWGSDSKECVKQARLWVSGLSIIELDPIEKATEKERGTPKPNSHVTSGHKSASKRNGLN